MKNKILIRTSDRKTLHKDRRSLGMNGENLQEVLLFCLDEKIEGTGIVEVELPDETKGMIEVERNEEGYELPIKSSLLSKTGFVKFQLRILHDNEEIFKSEIIPLEVKDSINATATIPEEYPSWVDTLTNLKKDLEKAESERVSNENTRNSNEDSRIANERERQTNYTNIQNKVNNGEFNGATYLPNVDAEGNISWTNNKGLENPSSQNIRGPQGIQGAQGEPFKIKKTYSSIEEMQTDFDNMEVGDYAMIANSVEIEDNAKLYYRTETEWVFITDFSGATGIQGPQGVQGIQGIQGERGIGISSLEVRDGSLYVTLTDNTQQNAGLIITDEVKRWIVNQVTDNAKSDFNTYYNGKIADFDEHTEQKTNEFDENAESLKAKVEELEKENKLIKEQIPGANASGNSIHVKDSGTLDFDWKINGRHKQETREGYNSAKLSDLDKMSLNGIEISIADEILSVNGTSTAGINRKITPLEITLNANMDYTFVAINDGTNSHPNDSSILIYKSDFSMLGRVKIGAGINIYNITPEEDIVIKEMHLYIGGAGIIISGNIKVMLLKGNYTADTIPAYEQYGVSPSPDYSSEIETVNGSVEIDVVNKNIMPIINLGTIWEYTTNGIKNITKASNKQITSFSIKKGQTVKLAIKLFSKPTADSTFAWFINKVQNTKLSFAKIHDYNLNQIYERSFTADEDCVIESSFFGNANSDIFEFQLWAEIDNLTDYKQHQSQTAIMPIQQEMLEGDYVTDVEHHEWGKYVFTGEEDYVKSSNYSDDKYFCGYIDIGLSGLNMKQGSAAYCTHFKRFGMYSNILNEECINITIQFHVRILASHLTENSAEAFKSWLKSLYQAGTPVIIYYKLAEPLNLELTAEQKSIRDTKLYTYKNITNISVSDELASIDVNYKKDPTTEHDELQNQIDEIKQLISTTETSALLLDNLQKDVESEVK